MSPPQWYESADVAATFCATLVDEWVRAGLTDVVVAPGSRSTPLTLAVAAEHRRVTSHVVLDERSAGFMALGLGLASGRPAVVVTTSGTAAAELHAAVAEAHHARVPLIVCTADRPPELQHVGAPQTIDQTRLYGGAVRFFADPGVAAADASGSWRSLAGRAWSAATGISPGPVQLNLPFREPLVGRAGPLPPGRPDGAPWHRRLVAHAQLDEAAAAGQRVHWAGRRGVIIAGAGVDEAAAVLALAVQLGWPVLADPRSGCRLYHDTVVSQADGFLRSALLADRLRPEVVLRFGDPLASKVIGQWLGGSGAETTVVDPTAAFADPDRQAAVLIPAPAGNTCRALCAAGQAGQAAAPDWLARWQQADRAAGAALDEWVATTREATEPGVARTLMASVEAGATVVASSSMPVRDVEWYAPPRSDVRVLANRGANGIDGVVSTAVGVALSGAPTWLLIGDLALLHDSNGLLAQTQRSVRLRIVVVDNGGGGIFSFLPQAGALESQRFERFYGTPQPVSIPQLLATHGITSRTARTADEVAKGLAELAESTAPVEALVVSTDRAANVEHHETVHRRMVAAAEAVLA
jgi:2-succinyl-5-enolpyruvyl-6-hydroxy-3-cyclohexene-1-carboxylate synthase